MGIKWGLLGGCSYQRDLSRDLPQTLRRVFLPNGQKPSIYLAHACSLMYDSGPSAATVDDLRYWLTSIYMHPEWQKFGERFRQRSIAVLDTLAAVVSDLLRASSIIIGDAFIILLGYKVTQYLDQHSDPKNAFFQNVRYVSLGAFLLLYTVFVARHLWREFFKKEE